VRINDTPTDVAVILGPGAYVHVRVHDTGVGMAPETRARIFEPFFTTKPEGHGMGLAAVYGAIRSHGGVITVESLEGRGTTFNLFLPAVEGNRSGSVSNATEAVDIPGQSHEFEGLHVLLVDDEPDILTVAEHILRKLGCRVHPCHNGALALARFEQDPSLYDLLIVDAIMPDVSGPDVLRELRSRGHHTPALIVSGHTGRSTGEHRPGEAFVPKPFTPSELARAMRRVLRGESLSSPSATQGALENESPPEEPGKRGPGAIN
jgi:CheY-like chemotaxis protein